MLGFCTVIVTRQHKNNNITAGLYLVDLKCLGVKDTHWLFNIPFDEFNEQVIGNEDEEIEPIEYTLAHNIIYAGHDFAMEYEISPHKDFAVTKYILEEDNDNIPLIDVEVGENGIPHLIVDNINNYKTQLNLLKKNAGEGNYLFSVHDGDFDYMGDEDEDDWEDEDEPTRLSEYERGTLLPEDALDLATDEFEKLEEIKSRGPNEQLFIVMEFNRRNFMDEAFDHKNDINLIYEEFDWFNDLELDPVYNWRSFKTKDLLENYYSFIPELQKKENQKERLCQFIISNSLPEFAFLFFYNYSLTTPTENGVRVEFDLDFEAWLSLLGSLKNENFKLLMKTFLYLTQNQEINHPDLISVLETKLKDSTLVLNKANKCHADLLSLNIAIKFLWYVKTSQPKMAMEYYYFYARLSSTLSAHTLFPVLYKSFVILDKVMKV